jgi:hypothetical protein
MKSNEVPTIHALEKLEELLNTPAWASHAIINELRWSVRIAKRWLIEEEHLITVDDHPAVLICSYANGETAWIHSAKDALSYMRGFPRKVQTRRRWVKAEKALCDVIASVPGSDLHSAMKLFMMTAYRESQSVRQLMRLARQRQVPDNAGYPNQA